MIYYLINMTPEEKLWCAFFLLLGICLIIGVIDAICEHFERKREKERRALKRYGVSIRPGRRY